MVYISVIDLGVCTYVRGYAPDSKDFEGMGGKPTTPLGLHNDVYMIY